MGDEKSKPIPCLWCNGTGFTVAKVMCRVCGGTGDASKQVELNRVKSKELLAEIMNQRSLGMAAGYGYPDKEKTS